MPKYSDVRIGAPFSSRGLTVRTGRSVISLFTALRGDMVDAVIADWPQAVGFAGRTKRRNVSRFVHRLQYLRNTSSRNYEKTIYRHIPSADTTLPASRITH